MTGLPLLEGNWDGSVRTLSEGSKGQEYTMEETTASCLAEPQVSCSFLAFAFCLMELILRLFCMPDQVSVTELYSDPGAEPWCILLTVKVQKAENACGKEDGQNSRASQWRSLHLL